MVFHEVHEEKCADKTLDKKSAIKICSEILEVSVY